jgi:uncharacterized protein YlxP (DUF503 family)
VGANDAWQRAVIGLTCVSNSGDHAHSVLMRAIRAMENCRLDAEVVDYPSSCGQETPPIEYPA